MSPEGAWYTISFSVNIVKAFLTIIHHTFSITPSVLHLWCLTLCSLLLPFGFFHDLPNKFWVVHVSQGYVSEACKATC